MPDDKIGKRFYCRMKFLFIVQGEGRGHLTQAISLKEILVKNGHEVVGVMVGKSNRRELPDFFIQGIQTDIYRFNSPNFLPSKKKTTSIWLTIAYNFLKAGTYLSSIFYIKKQIRDLQADVVINFYDMMAGLTYALFTPKIPCVCIAHQYLFLHPDYVLPEDRWAELYLLKFFTKITAAKASLLLALSTREMPSVPDRRMKVVPPLLRKDVFEIPVKKGNYLHGYMLNDTYADEIIQFQKKHPGIYVRFFWDRKGVPDKLEVNDYLSFHRLNDRLFLEYMAECMGYATTAGFESVCEAMYMGKPVLMVPTHIEQECNAFESSSTGAGIVAHKFELEKLLEFIPLYQENPAFKVWAKGAEARIIEALEELNTDNH